MNNNSLSFWSFSSLQFGKQRLAQNKKNLKHHTDLDEEEYTHVTDEEETIHDILFKRKSQFVSKFLKSLSSKMQISKLSLCYLVEIFVTNPSWILHRLWGIVITFLGRGNKEVCRTTLSNFFYFDVVW